MFFTWHGPKRTFHVLFHKLKAKLPDLPIQLSIGKSIHYLDIEIIQNNGILRTKVYRPGLTEQYTLPYIDNYPLHQYATRTRNHLINAIKSCINIKDFQDECLFMYSTYLLNRFPLDFIDHCIHQFFNEFNPSKLNYQYNQKAYESLRQLIIINVQVACLPTNNKRPSDDGDLQIETSMKRKKTKT